VTFADTLPVAMPARLPPHRDWSNQAAEQQLPFTSDNVSDAEFAQDAHNPHNTDVESQTPSRARHIRAQSNASATLSQSFSRNPIRSFAHQASHGFNDTPQYSSQGVRERSSQLASYALDTEEYQDRPHRPSFAEPETSGKRLSDYLEGRGSFDSSREDIIEEDSEAETPVTGRTVATPRRLPQVHQTFSSRTPSERPYYLQPDSRALTPSRNRRAARTRLRAGAAHLARASNVG
jgi:hypothetical protein